MGSLLGNLLGRFTSAGSAGQVDVAVFGKHPGAADHFEYLPAGDTILRDLWTLLYRRSMEELLAGWANLAPGALLPEFNHIFLWKRSSDWVAGRMWSSVDAGGRALFPLVVCVHGKGPPGDFVQSSVLPALQRMEAACKKAATIDQLRQIVDAAKIDLTARLAQHPPSPAQQQARFTQLLARPEFSRSPDGLHQLLYPFSQELSALLTPASRTASDSKLFSGLISSLSIRMPRSADSAEASLLAWQALLDRLVLTGTQTLSIAPLDQPWIDILTGNITTSGLFCMRASLEGRPMSADKTDSFPAPFVSLADRFIADCKAVDSPDKQPPAKPDGRASPAKLIPLIVLALLIVGGTAGLLYNHFKGKPAGQVTAPLPLKTSGPQPAAQADSPGNVVLTHSSESAASPVASDPRQDWPIQKRLDQIAANLKSLGTDYSAQTSGQSQTLAALRERADRTLRQRLGDISPSDLQNQMHQIDGDTDNLLRSVQDDLARRQSAAAWVQTARSMPSPVRDDFLAGKWREFRDRILQSAQAPDAQRASLATLGRLLGEIESRLPATAPDAVPAGHAWSKPIADRVQAVHNQNLARAVGLIQWKEDVPAEELDPGWKDLPAADKAFAGDAASVATDASAVSKMLDMYCPLDQPAPGGSDAPKQVFDRLNQSPACRDPEIQAALRPVALRFNQLRAIDQAATPADLAKAADQSTLQPLELHLARWRKLGSFADADFPTDAGLAQSLTAEINQLPDARLKSALTDEVARNQIARWTAAIRQSTTPDAAEALVALEPAGIATEGIDSPRIRFDVLLRTLKVKAADGPAEQLGDEVRQFLTTVQDLGDPVTRDPGVAQLLQKAVPLTSGQSTSAETGPPAEDHWTRQALPGGARFIQDGTGQTIDFALIQPKDSPPFYLESTEFPVGIAVNLMSDPRTLAAMLAITGAPPTETGANKSDFLRGPRGWVWKFQKDKPAGWMIATGWWPDNHTPVSINQLFSKALRPVDPPSPNQPLQQVSLPMAALLAMQLHCRLPTTAEWKLAEQTAPATATAPANLRDDAYAAQLKYLTDLVKSDVRVSEWLDSGIFTLGQVKAATESRARVWDRAAKSPSASPQDVYSDGVLLFRPVAAPTPAGATVALSDLVGNVSEFAFDKSEQWNQLGNQPAGDAMLKFFDSQSASCWVIGASALSAPEMGLDQPHPLAGQIRRCFSDVGFRLAFAAPPPPATDRLRDLIAQQPYLPAVPGPATRQ